MVYHYGYDGMGFWGMHFVWWVFWLVILTTLVMSIRPVSRRYWKDSFPKRMSPLEILQERFAKGEISTEDYDARKTKLENDIRILKTAE